MKKPSPPTQNYLLKRLPRSKKGRVISGILLVALLLLMLKACSIEEKTAENISFVSPERTTIEELVTAQGKLEPKEYVDVGAQVSGQLEKLHVEIGDNVKQGDLIAEIDPQVYQSRVEADKASLKTLKAQLAEKDAGIVLAKQQHARNQRLIRSKAISESDLETTANALAVAVARAESYRAQIEEAESTLKGDEANLSYTKIYAPFTGTVVSQTTREGQTVNANQTAPVIVQVANLDTMTVRAQVAEADVMRLKEGGSVYFTTLGAQERKWQAKIRQILPSPEVINDVVLYNVLIDVDNKDRQLMNGMSTQIFFELGRADNVLTIPAAALGKRMNEQDNASGQAYQVRVQGEDEATPRTVHIGLMNRVVAEVRAGISETDKVLVQSKPVKERNNNPRPPRMF